ncbi:hypothetical protein [Sphingomonas sp.]|uniref:hypothetical protein n=1 Tax=Sphingomonas sp. TaxID=28214 RepID=UPI003B3AFF0A
MRRRQTLLVGAGLGALGLAASPASAKPVHHVPTPDSSNTALLKQIQALRQQVADLAARLNATEAAQRQTTATVTTAQSAASAAATQAVQAQSAASAAQTAANNAATAAAKAAPAAAKTELATFIKDKWWDSTTISGRMYFNFSNIQDKVNGAKPTGAGSLNGTGFNIKRFYLGVDHTFSPVFAGNLTMDVSNVVGQVNNANFTSTGTPEGTNLPALVGKGFYIKKAYLQAKLNPALIIRLGAADLPWVPFSESAYGYRHIENTLIDRTNFGISADWGVHVLGDFGQGLVSYQISVVDGGGYRNVKVTRSVDVEGRVSVNYHGFYAGAGGYAGDRGNNVEGTPTPHKATRANALVGYKNKLLNAGVEYYHSRNWNNVTTVATDTTDGYSLFGNVNFAPTWSIFGRYDWVKPTQTTNDNLKDQYYNFGVQWEPVKLVDLALVYKHEAVDNGIFGTQNGVIGGPNPTGLLTGGHGSYREIGLFGQFRF